MKLKIYKTIISSKTNKVVFDKKEYLRNNYEFLKFNN